MRCTMGKGNILSLRPVSSFRTHCGRLDASVRQAEADNELAFEIRQGVPGSIDMAMKTN